MCSKDETVLVSYPGWGASSPQTLSALPILRVRIPMTPWWEEEKVELPRDQAFLELLCLAIVWYQLEITQVFMVLW